MGQIQNRVKAKVKSEVRPITGLAEPSDFESARQRTLEGTILLFDTEHILRKTANGRTSRVPYKKGQRVEPFTLAFVNSRVRVESEAKPPYWFTYKTDGLRGILDPLNEGVREKMVHHAVTNLRDALRSKADAVVFPEFALPPVDLSDRFPSIRDFNPFDPDDQAEVDKRFEQSAIAILAQARSAPKSESKTPLIFYGSMHCQRSRYNIGVVSPGDPFEDNYVLVAERGNPITPETEMKPEEIDRSGPLVHKKRFPARRAGETARVPGGLGFRLYPSKIGAIAIMICSDAIDLNQFWYIVRHNQRADFLTHTDRIGLVIVPAYTHSALLHTTCRDLSILARTTVFVGNATGKLKTKNPLHTTDMPPPAIYQCGRDEPDLRADHTLKIVGDADITYYEFKPAPPAR